ncbi:hypothetical protein ID866_9920 [Astraeus odoratus]|nr:hypothetical protein ID866_9920 [Astraeus odoratus]
MRENITKVAERGERLDSLQDKTDNLAVSAQGFRRGANRVRKVSLQPSRGRLRLLIRPFYRTCGEWKDMKASALLFTACLSPIELLF